MRGCQMDFDTAISRPGPRVSRAGFSLVEALVVLAITAMTLSLLFSMAGRGVDAGFRIGRSALDQADRSIETETLRSLLESLRLPLLGITEDPAEMPSGTASEFSGLASLTRPTPCGARGVYGRLALEIEIDEGGSTLTCVMNGGEPVVVLTHPGTLAFSYSENGTEWSPVLGGTELSAVQDEETVTVRERRLFVRLADAAGAFEVIGRASSGRPEAVLAIRDESYE